MSERQSYDVWKRVHEENVRKLRELKASRREKVFLREQKERQSTLDEFGFKEK